MRWTYCLVLLAGATVDCTCRDSAESEAPPAHSAPSTPTPNPTPSPTGTPTPSPAPGSGADARVQAWLGAHSLAANPERYTLFDVNGDGLTDVVHDQGLALQTATGFDEQRPLETSSSMHFAPPLRTARATLLAYGALGHETDHSAGQTSSDTWFEWTIYAFEGGRTREVFSERFDENSAFGALDSLRLDAVADGSVLEVAGPQSRVLRWDGASLKASTCWSATRATSAGGQIAGCIGTTTTSVHFRDTDRADRDERADSAPAGTELSVFGAGTTRRGSARLYCVADGARAPAWVFLTRAELSDFCPEFD